MCPCGAAFTQANGIVRIHPDVCMGGAKCKAVRPWRIPERQSGVGLHLDLLPQYPGNGVMYQCDRCYQRIQAASILVALAGYAALTSRMDRRPPTTRRSLSGKVRAMQPGLALAAGIVMVVKNLPGVHLPLYALVACNLAHRYAAVLFMIAAVIALVFGRPWRLIA